MKINRSFKIAINIIFHSKLRSWLTIIGIVIGIAAVVSIVSIGQGAQRTLAANLNSLSANIITINPGFSRAAGAGAAFRGGGGFPGGEGGFGGGGGGASTAKNLTVNDLMVIKTVPNVQYAMGIISGTVDNVTYLSKTARVNVEGVDPAVWKNIDTTAIVYGRYLSQGDVNAVVVGGRVANSTFSNIGINSQIIINGKNFNVVGILKTGGGSDDSRIFMPLQTAVTVIPDKDTKDFDSITIKINDISQSDATVSQLTTKLLLSHGILQSSKQDFSVTSQQALQQNVSSTLSSLSIFLTAIAAISLLVGAIGIMNTMFTSVLEKTRDIGILKALGAKNRDILSIFLLNSGIIGLIGGVFGVIIGIFASGYIGDLGGISGVSGGPGGFGRLLSSSYVSPLLVAEVFILAIVIGLIAGAIPAYRASKLEPVDALRYE